MNAVNTARFVTQGDRSENGNSPVTQESQQIEVEVLDNEYNDTAMTADTLVKSLPSDVTLIVQNPSYTLKILESYKGIISKEMRTILQDEGHRSYNFQRYSEVLRNITTAIKLKTDFIRDLFRRLTKEAPENIARTSSYSSIVHYQKSLLDYQQIVIHKQKRLRKELKTLRNVLGKFELTFVILRNRAKEISEVLSSLAVEEIISYPPQELEEFRVILESTLNEDTETQTPQEIYHIWRQALIKVLEAIGIQTLSVKENRKYQEILNDIDTYLGPEKAVFVTKILTQFSSMSPREIVRKYDATMIKHYLFLLSHLTLLLETQENVQILEQYHETSKRISEALNITLNPYKGQLGLQICNDLAGIQSDELAAYQTPERIQEYHKVLASSISASEDDEDEAGLLIRRKTMVKVLEAEGIQTLMSNNSAKHKKYQELLGDIEQHLQAFKDGFLKERLAQFSGLTPQTIAQTYRVNSIKHNVLLLARLSLLLNMQENAELMFEYYTVSKNIFEALNLKLEEGKTHRDETDMFRSEAKTVLLESDLFRALSSNAIERIVDQFELMRFSKDTVVIQKGQKGEGFYVIKAGRVRVGVPRKDGTEIPLAILRKSDCFGEMSLLTGNPAAASITSLDDLELLCLSEEHFNDILLEYPVLNRYFHRILSERLRDASARAKDEEQLKGLAGKLSTISLDELIQTLYTANKTGVLTVDNHGDKGKIFIKNGLVVHVITKNLKGEQAFFRVTTWKNASFRFIPGEVNVERSVTMNVHGLLLEAMKRLDDMRQIKQL